MKPDHLCQNGIGAKQSPLSIRPASATSSVLLPAITPVSIAVSETSAFTGVPPTCTTPLQEHDDVVTTSISSPSGASYFSEDDLTESPLQHQHSNNGYHGNVTTISFAQHHRSRSKRPSLLVTAEVHAPLENTASKNVANSSSIMTPVSEGVTAPSLMKCTEQDMNSTLLDSWSEAELMVPGTPDKLVDSDNASDVPVVATSIGKTASSSLKETFSSSGVRPKPHQLNSTEAKATKPVKSKSFTSRKKRRSHQLANASDSSTSDIIPPASVATAPGLKPWQSNTKKLNDHIVTMPTVMQSSDPLVTMTSTTHSSEAVRQKSPSAASIQATGDNDVMTEEHCILPLSNSPVDIVIMLFRMATFCASMTKVLSPKLPVNASLPTTGNV